MKKILFRIVFVIITIFTITISILSISNGNLISFNMVKTYDKSSYFLNTTPEQGELIVLKPQSDATNSIVFSSEEDSKIETIVLKLIDNKTISDLDIKENIVNIYENINTVNIEVPKGTNVNEIIKKYEDNLLVEEAFVDEEVRLLYNPTDPYYSLKQWNLSSIKMESAWDISKGSSSIVVAVVDSGIGPFLDIDGLVNGADTSGGTILEDTFPGQYSYEGDLHGTAVASLIASNIDSQGIAGIAPNVSLMSVKAFPNGSDTTGLTQIASGIVWAVDHGADIINLSIGTYADSSVMRDAVYYASSNDVLLVAASGNDYLTNSICFPAAYDEVVAVGSVGITDKVSDFSNKGNSLNIVAPGENIYLANYQTGSFNSFSGTSFSSPTVAALAALVKSEYPSYSSHVVKQILYTGTDDIDINGWDNSSGFGIINAEKVMNIAANPFFDDNDTIETADAIAVNKDFLGENYLALDEDYYKFTLYESYKVTVSVTPTANQDFGLELYDSTYHMISRVNANFGGNSEILTYTLEKGSYYINIYDVIKNSSDSEYNILIAANDTVAPKISLLQNSILLENGSTASTDVALSIEDTSFFEVEILKNNEFYSMPINSIFTESGVYKISVTDSLGNISTFNFNINKNLPLNIDFNSQGGSTVKSLSAIWGNIILEPETPTYSGYTFKGWYKDTFYTKQWNFNNDNVYSDMILYAKWSRNVLGITRLPLTITIKNIGEMQQLITSVIPEDADNQNLKWQSNNTEVVTVSSSGNITAISDGIAVITATTEEGGYISTSEITVQNLSGVHYIKSKSSKLVMDIYNGGRSIGTNIIQWPYHGRTNQQWKFESLGNGYYKITSVLNPTYSLDVYDAGTREGNRVIQWLYHGGTNQQWKIIGNEDGSISLMSRQSEENGTRFLLDVYGGGIEPGVNVIQWSGNGGDNQKWQLEPVKAYTMSYDSNGGSAVASSSVRKDALADEPQAPTKEGMIFTGWYQNQALTNPWDFAGNRMPAEDMTLYAKWHADLSGTYVIRSVNSDLVMDVYDGGTKEGTNIIQWGYHGRENQQWRFESLGNGYYKIISVLSPAYSLDVYDAGTSEGNRVIQWTYHGGTNQQWKVTENADGSYTLMSRLAVESGTRYVLDVFGGGMEPGVNVIQWSCNGGDNQKWQLEAVE